MPAARTSTQGNLERCKLVYDLSLHEPWLSQKEIATQVGVSRATVQRWLADPAAWSPFYDEVALERATGGDRAAYRGLSFWETHEFHSRLAALKRDMYVSEWAEFIHDLCVNLSVRSDALCDSIRSAEPNDDAA